MDDIRVLLAIGNAQIEDQVRNQRGISVIDSDTDIEVITDILDYEDADFIIVNTVLSGSKSRTLAEKAQKKGIKVIALVESHEDKALIAGLIGFGVAAFVDFSELNKISMYLKDYPEVSFDSLYEEAPAAIHKRISISNRMEAERARGKICIGVFGATEGSGVTSTAVYIAESVAMEGYKVAVVAMDQKDDLKYINPKKARAIYYPFSGGLEDQVHGLYKDVAYQIIIFDFGTPYRIDSEGNFLNVSAPSWILREFTRCPYKVAVTFADAWHIDKLKYYLRSGAGMKGEVSFLVYSGNGGADFEKEYDLPAYAREEFETFLCDLKISIGIAPLKRHEMPIKKKWRLGRKGNV